VSLVDRAYEQLRAQILDGSLGLGERLGEEELSEAIGVSRTPIREALRRLAGEGLVEVTPNRGARVARWGDEDLLDIFDLRVLLEGHGAELAARDPSPQLLAGLAELAQEMDALAAGPPEHFDRLAETNRVFHEQIQEASGSPRLGAMVDSLVHVPVMLQTYRRYSPAALERSMRHHHELIDALRARDGFWARSIMHAHVLAARDELLRRSRPDAVASDGDGDAAVG
jgi:DNA-binding GntR family transcriptional regulator